MKTYYIREHQKTTLPVAVKWDRVAPKYQCPHRHDGYEIMFVRSGCGWCRINERSMPILPGDLFMMGERDEHEFSMEIAGDYFTVMFRPEMIFEADQAVLRGWSFFGGFGRKEFAFTGKCVFPPHVGEGLFILMERLWRDAEEGGVALPLLLRARVYELLARIGQYSALFHGGVRALAGAVAGGGLNAGVNGSDLAIGRVVDFVHQHYAGRPSLAAAAKRTGHAPAYLGKLFRRRTGIAFVNYVAYVRVEKARALLESDAMALTEIASRTGFHDASHFARTFRRITGMRPGEFRNHCRASIPRRSPPSARMGSVPTR